MSPGSDEIVPGWEAHLRHRGGPALDGAITPRVGVGRGLSHVSLLSENSSKRRSADGNPRLPSRASLRPCESTSAPTARAIRRPSRAVEFTPNRVDDPSERRGPPSHYAPTARAPHASECSQHLVKKKLRLWCRACAGRRWYRAPCIDAGFARASLLTPVYVHEGTQGPVAWRPVAMEPCRFATVVPSQTCNRGAVPVRRIADLLNRFFFPSESARCCAKTSDCTNVVLMSWFDVRPQTRIQQISQECKKLNRPQKQVGVLAKVDRALGQKPSSHSKGRRLH